MYQDTPEAYEYNKSGVLPSLSDKFLVWGEIFKKYSIDCGISPNKIEIIGNVTQLLGKIDEDGSFFDFDCGILGIGRIPITLEQQSRMCIGDKIKITLEIEKNDL